MADSANTCPICNKPLSNGHCDECGYYNDSARVATAHAERADRAQRQAQGDAGYKNIIDERRDAANPQRTNRNAYKPDGKRAMNKLTVIMGIITLMSPVLGMIIAVAINASKARNGNTDEMIDMKILGYAFGASIFLLFVSTLAQGFFE